MNTLRSTALLVLTLLSACSLATKTDPLSPWDNAENFCFAYADLAAKATITCGPATTAAADAFYRAATEGMAGCTAIQAAVDAGRLTYDSGKGKSCLEALDSGVCSTVETACEGVLIGAVAVGGVCKLNKECSSPYAYCNVATCPGVCAYRVVGDHCESDAECDPSIYFCATTGTVANTCQARVSPGFGCGLTTEPSICALGYYCNSTSQTCVPRLTGGMVCSDTLPCNDQLGLACDPWDHFCVSAPTGPSPIGGKCGGGFTCDKWTAFCDTTASPPTCRSRFALDMGISCTSSEACTRPGVCARFPGFSYPTCGATRLVGQQCVGGQNSCIPGAWCDGSADIVGTCQALPQIGEPCQLLLPAEQSDCLGSWCNGSVAPGNRTCVAYRQVGESCGNPGSAPCDPVAGLVCSAANVCVQLACFGAP